MSMFSTTRVVLSSWRRRFVRLPPCFIVEGNVIFFIGPSSNGFGGAVVVFFHSLRFSVPTRKSSSTSFMDMVWKLCLFTDSPAASPSSIKFFFNTISSSVDHTQLLHTLLRTQAANSRMLSAGSRNIRRVSEYIKGRLCTHNVLSLFWEPH